jgi:hypothetical protein
MRRHHIRYFQMLRYKCLNVFIATDTYFAGEKSIEGYHSAHVFFKSQLKGIIVHTYFLK